MYSFNNKDLIDFYQKIILVFQNVKNNYKKLKDYLEKYYHLINEFVNYAFSFIIKENRIMNNLLISNNEVKKVQNQFFELIENLITSFGEFVNRIKEQIKC
jgi:3-methyladenine DNA glycosylase AlkD